MPELAMMPTLFRELLGRRALARTPEPDLVMADALQIADYVAGAQGDGGLESLYHFHAVRSAGVIAGRKTVIDLACGPAVLLAQLAQLHPETSFLGVDLSQSMLDVAAARAARLGLTNLYFARADIATLDGIADGSADAVVSSMALHHLPSLEHLRACFHSIRRVLRPSGAVYLADLARLKSARSVRFLVERERDHYAPLMARDYERSLQAAFSLDELGRLAREELPESVRVYGTFGVRFLAVAKSPDRPLPPPLRARLRERALRLSTRGRRDLTDLRLLFYLGGLGGAR